MIILNNISLDFGKQTVFDSISGTMTQDDRIGLVGRNGSGKSTLLKVIAGLQLLDGGSISVEKGATIGYLPQHVVLQSDKSIFDEALASFGPLVELLAEADRLEQQLQEKEVVGDEDVLERYAAVHQELIEQDVAQAEVETKKILTGLGFAPDRLTDLVSTLSVGWRMRVVLAKLLLKKADFYLFDEPTNHLDMVTKEWFLRFLHKAPFGFILVTHDRYFLDRLCNKIIELDRGKSTVYYGNYTLYEQQKEERLRETQAAASRQQKEFSKKMKTIDRFRASASKSKMAQSMLKRLEKVDRIEVGSKQRTMAFTFPPISRSGRVVLSVENVAHSFGRGRLSGRLSEQIFKDVSFELERGEHVALIAPNGVGKTTLFNIITGLLPLQEGTVTYGHKVTTALFEQDQDKVLNFDNTILKEVEGSCASNDVRALVRKFLGAFLFSGDDVKKKISVLSGGEKNRVAMVKVLLQQANFLLLDEPTNHLDIESKEILLSALQRYEGSILFVSHDRDFLDKLATRVLVLSAQGLSSYPGNYESYLYHMKEAENAQKEAISRQAKGKKKGKKSTRSNNKATQETRRRINKLEGSITRLEGVIERCTKELETLEYGDEQFTARYEQLTKAQKDLETAIASWESLQ